MTINAIANTTATAGTSTQGLSASLNTFLTLLTTQLQNQDPLSPMDTAEFTNQLVLYTQAEQQIKTNDSLQDLITIQRGTIGTQALGYIGKNVGFLGTSLHTDGTGGEHPILYSLAAEARQFSIAITDADGKTVRTMEGDNTAGNHEIVWDGTDNNGDAVPAGNYEVKITARDSADKAINVQTVVNAVVTGLESDGNGSVNLMLNGERTIGLSSIFSVWQPSVPVNQNNQS